MLRTENVIFVAWCVYLQIIDIDKVLSSELGARQAQREVVKIKFFDFYYWASSTP